MHEPTDRLDEDALRRAIEEALMVVLSRGPEGQTSLEHLKVLRAQLKTVLAEAPTQRDPVQELATRALLASAFESEIQKQEDRLVFGREAEEGGAVQRLGDRRRWPRRPVRLNGQVEAGDASIGCVVLDLSEGGAQVEIDRPASVPDLVALKIKGHGTYPARRRWVDGTRVGFEFLAAA